MPVKNVGEIGWAVRERRRAAGLSQERASGLAGVGARFLGELERGKPTVELGRTLQVLQALGLELELAPREAARRDGRR